MLASTRLSAGNEFFWLIKLKDLNVYVQLSRGYALFCCYDDETLEC